MSSLGKSIGIRLMAIVLCLIAFGIHIMLAPTPAYANGCSCNGAANGSCSNGAECVCMFSNGVCVGCQSGPEQC